MSLFDGFSSGTLRSYSGKSGGANTSHTILLPALIGLLDALPSAASYPDYEEAVVLRNVLGKTTEASRRRTLRYLRELYELSSDRILFRALRDLWGDDAAAQPAMAALCATVTDPSFRASSGAILASSPGDVLTSSDLATAVEEVFPDSYSEGTLAKIGRNTFSSWEQTGHLAKRKGKEKTRARAVSRPANVAYALLLGHLAGARGDGLFETIWAKLLDAPRSHLMDLAVAASQRGFIEFKRAGGVVDVGFRELLRPMDETVV